MEAIYYFSDWRHFWMWLDWNLYANGNLFLMLCWSWILASSLMGLRVKLWQALCNILAVCLTWMFVCYAAYGTGLG